MNYLCLILELAPRGPYWSHANVSKLFSADARVSIAPKKFSKARSLAEWIKKTLARHFVPETNVQYVKFTVI